MHTLTKLTLDELRETKQPKNGEEKQSRVITVRMSAKLHQAAREFAHHQKVSLNQACIYFIQNGIINEGPDNANQA